MGLFPPRSNFISRTNQIMQWLKSIFIGRARNLSDERLFHKISLVAVLAWMGLGADGLSSSCYGPEETFKALGACSAIIEAEANYGAGQLLFLGERFITEAKSYPIAFDALKKLKGVYDNTMTTTMWRFVELAWPELPMVGIVSCHPHRARRPADFNPEDPCRHFIQSPAFAQRFSQLSEKEVFEKVAEYCGGQRGGPLGECELILQDDNEEAHYFFFESFYNQHDALTLGRWLKKVPVAIAV